MLYDCLSILLIKFTSETAGTVQLQQHVYAAHVKLSHLLQQGLWTSLSC